jgi:DNA (cytosine-5)-methyltransferase 1
MVDVKNQAPLQSRSSQLILSLFPGIGLLDRGFEAAGFCVVRGPDLLWGGDVRTFAPPAGVFAGVIGGPPCQDWSGLNRDPGGYGREMLDQFARMVVQARPVWWLMENVARVSDLRIDGYSWQRLDLKASDLGLRQSRLRHFQFGHRDNLVLTVAHGATVAAVERCCLASEGNHQDRRGWVEFCELQGLPRDFSLPGMTRAGRYAAVGNGVPVPVAVAVAEGVADLRPCGVRVCACGCGREVLGKAVSAGPACRKRLQRRRDASMGTSPG